MKLSDEFQEQLECDFCEEEYKIEQDCIQFIIPKTNLLLELNEKHLKKLANNRLITNIKDLKFHKHYGFSYKNYGEYFIGTNDGYLYDMYGDATEIDLKFKIDKAYIEFNHISSICVLLMNPYYTNKAYYLERGLGEYFCTLKIHNLPSDEHKNLIIKALYYLNTHYLKKTNSTLTVFHLIPENYEIIEDNDVVAINDEVEKKYLRKRTLVRKDFINIEPIILFLNASILPDENAFLGFYRVIEFFFNRALEKELEQLRHNDEILVKEIIKKIQNKDERSLLINLLNKVLTKYDKKRLIDYLQHKKIISSDKFSKFSNTLYKYRNSLVHSKETQIDKVDLPDLFQDKPYYIYWNYTIKYIAEACIKRLNTKK